MQTRPRYRSEISDQEVGGRGEIKRPLAAQPEVLDFSEKCRFLVLS